MEFEKAREFILSKIQKELPKILYYHSYQHVLDVLQSAESLAALEGISGEDYTLLRTAVLYHDSGFVIQLQNHELAGCAIARDTLPSFDYSEEQIEVICGMIMATRIPQTPTNKLEEIICDADLDYLGRDDFWQIGGYLFRELKELNVLSTEKDWNKLQLSFLSNHHYFTESARSMRQDKKRIHLEKIKSILESITD